MSAGYSSKTSSSDTALPSPCPPLGSYKIESRRVSEPSCILFARHNSTAENVNVSVSVVLKLLFEYQDTRYSLSTVRERQKCQVEALQWNRIFTPKVHIGLAHICNFDWDQRNLEIDDIIENPSLETLAPNIEYALLMRQLPDSRRLDYILAEENSSSLQRYIQLLIKYVVHIHTNLTASSISMENATKWGSFVHLQKKLAHNMEFLDQIMATSKNDDYGSYYQLKDTLLQVFEKFKYLDYFERRVHEERIKRCHADLKAPNIWIAPLPLPGTQNEYWYDKEPWKYVYLLDAVDFNPMYSYIDILSDFAMLVTDIHAHTKSLELANHMIENYLELTNQQDKASRLVLAYYLVEKAIIGAAVSILYDNVSDVGLDFLEVASTRMIDLERKVRTQHHLSVVKSPILAVESPRDLISDKVKAEEDNTAKKGFTTTKRRRFTAGFKAQVVVDLIRKKYSVSELCDKHQLSRQMLLRWEKEFLERAPYMFEQEQVHKRIARLERLVDQLKMDLDIAKKPPPT
jgi:transposase